MDEPDSNDQLVLIPPYDSDIPHGSWIKLLSKDMENRDMLMISSLSEVGFRLSDNSFLYGPIAVFPKTALSWRVPSPEHITPESLELFFMLQPKLDILIVGAGDRKDIDMVRKQVSPAIAEHRIGHEILSTEDAIATFNFLNVDHRYVAAALFPPRDILISEMQMMERIADFQAYDTDINTKSFGTFAIWDTFFNSENPDETFVVRDAAYRIWGFRSEKAEEMLKKICKVRAAKMDRRIERLEEKIERTQKENYLEAKKRTEELENAREETRKNMSPIEQNYTADLDTKKLEKEVNNDNEESHKKRRTD